MKIRNVALRCLNEQNVDGICTYFLFDPWVQGGRMIDNIGRDFMVISRTERLIVGDLLNDRGWI